MRARSAVHSAHRFHRTQYRSFFASLPLVEFLEMLVIRGKAGVSMAIQGPDMRNLLSRRQLLRSGKCQRIYEAEVKSLCDTQHMSAAGVATGVGAPCLAAETNIPTPYLNGCILARQLTSKLKPL
jgi:hypothetical protein